MGKIEQNKEMKRRAILKAAQDVFLSEGYLPASMDKIAKQAQVTKQTIYRYYPSKTELFEATLRQIGESPAFSFMNALQQPDINEALYQFARGFIRAHLSDDHLATIRLLIAESAKAPEITKTFFEVGPDDTQEQLSAFFTERLKVQNPQNMVQMWTSMLFALRSRVLVGMEKPTDPEIDQYAKEATDFLLAAIR